MTPSSRHLALAAVVLGCLGLSPHALAFDQRDLPESLRDGYVGPIVGPADSDAYARGHLGIVRPGYGRVSLYVAWRVMQLPPGALASESHQRLGNAFLDRRDKPYRAGQVEIDDWLQARGALVSEAPQARPDYFRTTHSTVAAADGGRSFEITSTEGNCGADAFAFATRTLHDLGTDASLNDADRRAWIAGQDAVFARCAWLPGAQPAPALPLELPANAPAKLKALRAYQHAAALFYSEDFEHARQEFDAIAATPGHPMRAWAALGAMRSVVRPAGLDTDWQAAFNDAYTRQGLRGAALSAALAPAAAKHRGLAESTMKDVSARFKAISDDPALAEVKPAAQYTARRALEQLAPARAVLWTMDALDHVDWNPYSGRMLDLWNRYYASGLPERPAGPMLDTLRRHAFFDWIASVQACGDALRQPDEAICGDEHAHALARWQETKRDDWLLATLMTARRPTPADLPAAEAARTVSRDTPEWASLQFHAARVFRTQGRANDARALLDRLAGAPELEGRDNKLVDAERLALSH